MKSVAPPSQFDLSDLSIKLTAKEILTVSYDFLRLQTPLTRLQFFPNHVNILEIQQRFKESDTKGTFQAMFIVSNPERQVEQMYRAKLTHLREEPSASPSRPRDLHAHGRPQLGQKSIRKERRGSYI
jgi:hypothetical protein